MPRKKPIRHVVGSYKRKDGTKVDTHERGSGSKRKTRSRIVGSNRLDRLFDRLIVSEENEDWEKSDKIVEKIGKLHGWNFVDPPDRPMWQFRKGNKYISIDMTGGRAGRLPIHVRMWEGGEDGYFSPTEELPIIWDDTVMAVRKATSLMKKYGR